MLDVPADLLDQGGLIPTDRERLWTLIAHLAEVDPNKRQHDPLALLVYRPGARLVDVIGTPAPLPDPTPTPEGAPLA